MDNRYFNCVGCHKNMPVNNFDFKPNTTAPYSRCRICKEKHNESYVKRQLPFEKSFASFKDKTTLNGKLKVDCWHPTRNGNVKPRDVILGTHKKYWFKCADENCGHDFDTSIDNVTHSNPTWCRYCARSGGTLCDDEKCIHCFKKSFASFGGKTPNGLLKVDCWNKEKNCDVKPRDVSIANGKKYWFKCADENCGHDFDMTIGNVTSRNPRWCRFCASQALCDDECIPCFEKSFASFKGKTTLNGKLKVDCWHPTRNGNVKPRDVSLGTHKKYWFKCPECKHDIDTSINSVTSSNPSWCRFCAGQALCDDECIPCFEKSFASFGGKTPNGVLKVDCWHPTINGNVKPRNVSIANNKKYWFKCPECKHDFDISINHVTCSKSCWCQFCAGRKLCNDKDCIPCFKKSFASFGGKTPNGLLKVDCWNKEKNGDVKPRDVSIANGKKYWFKCTECKHDFDMGINHVTSSNPSWCRYCARSGGTLCDDEKCIPCFKKSFASFEGLTLNGKLKVDCWHKEKNGDIKPRDISIASNKKYWFLCPECKHYFDTSINNVTSRNPRWCPMCKNKTEKKFYEYLLMLETILSFNIKSIEKNYRPSWADLKQTHRTFYEYDFYIVLTNGVKIIFEIDGPQHYTKISNWSSVLKNQIRDEIKTRLAIKQEINLVRLNQEDILYDKNNWDKTVNDFIQKKYECNDEIEIYDCADGERYQ